MVDWTASLDTLIASGEPIERTLTLEVRNGYVAKVAGAYTPIPIKDWGLKFQDNNPCISSARFVIASGDMDHFDEFDHANPVQMLAEARLKLEVETAAGTETNYIWRGTLQEPQQTDFDYTVGAVDPMNRLQDCLAETNLEATVLGPYTDVELRQAPGYDPGGTFRHYEVDPTFNCPGPLCQDWAEDVNGLNRVWVPTIFTVQKWNGLTWDDVTADQYEINIQLGLVIFSSDQGAGTRFQIVEMSVYQEGTLELADVIEHILTLTNDCTDFGCGFTAAQTRTALTGALTLTNGLATATGAGTLFLAELSEGDRIALVAAPTEYAIVDTVTDNFNLILRYPFAGVGGAGAFFKSTLRESGISLTNINWDQCDGTAAQLYRELQKSYADSRGYKIWYDHMNDQVIGDRVAILDGGDPNIIPLGPKGKLKTNRSSKDIATAVSVSGTVAKSENLMSLAGITVTDIIIPTPDPPGYPWAAGPATGGAPQTYGGLTFTATTASINDQDLYQGYAVFKDQPTIAASDIAVTQYFDFLLIDLLQPYDLSVLILYMVNIKNSLGEKQGVKIYGSADNVVYTALSPESIGFDMAADEVKELDVEGVANGIRYIKILCRPFHWPLSGKEVTMGFREIIIFGTQKVCAAACIQDATPYAGYPGPPVGAVEGVGGHFIGGSQQDADFIVDYYPDLVAKQFNTGYITKLDDSGLILTEASAVDRAYLILNEMIRLYRLVGWLGAFDPRVRLFDTVEVDDDYRTGAPETLRILVQGIDVGEFKYSISGTEYGAGVLE